MAANVIARPEGILGRRRGFGPDIGGGIGDRRNLVTVMASVGEKRNAEVRTLIHSTASVSAADHDHWVRISCCLGANELGQYGHSPTAGCRHDSELHGASSDWPTAYR